MENEVTYKMHQAAIFSAIQKRSDRDLEASIHESRRHLPLDSHRELLYRALVRSFNTDQPSAIIRLIQKESAPIENLDPGWISLCPTVPVLEALVEVGWDINRQDRHGERLLHMVVEHEEAVRWLVDHGARIDRGQFDNEYDLIPHPAPILETCAKFGSLATFKFLQEHGARLSRRTLHMAALAGSEAGADPGQNSSMTSSDAPEPGIGDDKERWNRAEILCYLVDNLGLDVNQIDSDIPRHLHWGTPVNYAAMSSKGLGVVTWLLNKGADPSIPGLDSGKDAEALAMNFPDIVDIIQKWKSKYR